MKIVRIISFCVIAFYSLAMVWIGTRILIHGIRARGDVWSAQYGYFGVAGFLLIPGLLALFFARQGAFRPRRFSWVNWVFAVGILLYMGMAIPSIRLDPTSSAASSVMGKMRTLQTAAGVWAEAQGRYPLTQQDLNEVIKGSSLDVSSPYQRKDER